jgi:hypothetical protein
MKTAPSVSTKALELIEPSHERISMCQLCGFNTVIVGQLPKRDTRLLLQEQLCPAACGEAPISPLHCRVRYEDCERGSGIDWLSAFPTWFADALAHFPGTESSVVVRRGHCDLLLAVAPTTTALLLQWAHHWGGMDCLATEGIASSARVSKFRGKISGQVDRGQRPISGPMESCVGWTTAHPRTE